MQTRKNQFDFPPQRHKLFLNLRKSVVSGLDTIFWCTNRSFQAASARGVIVRSTCPVADHHILNQRIDVLQRQRKILVESVSQHFPMFLLLILLFIPDQ